ncbi:hypothetical protein BVI2075_780014 [Burkholderia vietnamiensis]|nr:hypothetical protein BVI2075_780014 [Burkholderia vietnamiensis]
MGRRDGLSVVMRSPQALPTGVGSSLQHFARVLQRAKYRLDCEGSNRLAVAKPAHICATDQSTTAGRHGQSEWLALSVAMPLPPFGNGATHRRR